MHTTQALEGVTLASFAFQENSHIISVFTKEHGRLKCVTKSYRKSNVRGLCPLLGVEIQVIVSDKELWKCKECLVTTSYPNLRLSLDHLRFSAQVTDLLDKLLPLHHPVPQLYELYKQFLANLPHFKKPHVAACIFLENFLVSEGMLDATSAVLKGSLTESYEAQIDLGYYHKLVHTLIK